jgi:hypothetical protein
MFKNLKSLFIVTDETVAPEKNSAVGSQSAAVAPNPAAKGPAPIQSKIDEKIVDKLIQAIEENNQPGFDYLEYRQALKSLASLPMDEATKFQSAFATASTMGLTLEKLLSSIDFYKKVLQNEEDKFNRATKDQSSINIEGKLKEKDSLDQLIKEKSQKIQELTSEIRQHQIDIQEISKFVETTELKIKETTLNFENSLNLLRSQMDEDSVKLKQYIK